VIPGVPHQPALEPSDVVSYSQTGGCVRCSRCGNENLEANRFCGMCGATLLSAPPLPPRKTVPVSAVPLPEAPAPRPQIVEPVRAEATEPKAPPTISGPSFLGLNKPAPAKRANLSLEPHPPDASHNVDYLLEDEEPPRRSGGWTKFILILLALALAGGLGYLRWKNQAFGWLNPASKHIASTPSSSTDDAATPSATGSTEEGKPSASSQPPQTATSLTDSTQNGNTANPTSNTSANSSAPSTPTPNPASTDAVPATTGPATAASSDTAKTADQPKSSDGQPAATPPAPTKAAKPTDPIAESEKYLYGRGVRQDCDRGLRILKPAVNQGKPKATMEMGALYSNGTCVPRDLPTAYRWYAVTLHKEPDNQVAQAELQKLWGEMTQPERQVAIKLTQ